MSKAYDWLKPIADHAARSNPPEDGDYIDSDGYLCCGKCGSRREMDLPVQDDPPVTMKVRVMCKCRKEAEDQQVLAEKQSKEMKIVTTLRNQSLMDDRLRSASFGNFRKTKYNARNLELCKRYVDKFDLLLEKNQGLLFYGGIGTGKTYAAACIANSLLERKTPVVMTSFIKLLEEMQGFGDNSRLIARLNRAKLLIIDDLGAERGTDFALEQVYNIVDSRYRAKRPMILTTNLSFDQMKDATDIRYSRIYDRIFEMCYPMQFSGPSWRKVEASKRFKDMESLLEG